MGRTAYSAALRARLGQDAAEQGQNGPVGQSVADLGRHPAGDVFLSFGNRSALEWVIDQYQVSEDKRCGIRSGPNRPDDPEYIARLVCQVVRVSVETVRIVATLPENYSG